MASSSFLNNWPVLQSMLRTTGLIAIGFASALLAAQPPKPEDPKPEEPIPEATKTKPAKESAAATNSWRSAG